MNIYPILSPKVHFNKLSSNMAVLTNMETFNTKLLKEYQEIIINECKGSLTVEEIKLKLLSQGIEKNIVNQVDEYIKK